MGDLETVPTKDLLAEVMRRYDVAVFAAVKSGLDETQLAYGGSLIVAVGIAAWAQSKLLDDVKAGDELVEESDLNEEDDE